MWACQVCGASRVTGVGCARLQKPGAGQAFLVRASVDLSIRFCYGRGAWSFPFSSSFHTCESRARAVGLGTPPRGVGGLTAASLVRSFVWKKDNAVLTPSGGSRAVVEKDGSLLISQTWSGDIGDYTCEVLSEGGNDSRAARLEVM